MSHITDGSVEDMVVPPTGTEGQSSHTSPGKSITAILSNIIEIFIVIHSAIWRILFNIIISFTHFAPVNLTVCDL